MNVASPWHRAVLCGAGAHLNATTDMTKGVPGTCWLVRNSSSGYVVFSTVSLSTRALKVAKYTPLSVCSSASPG